MSRVKNARREPTFLEAILFSVVLLWCLNLYIVCFPLFLSYCLIAPVIALIPQTAHLANIRYIGAYFLVPFWILGSIMTNFQLIWKKTRRLVSESVGKQPPAYLRLQEDACDGVSTCTLIMASEAECEVDSR